jgi:hypothetical protein
LICYLIRILSNIYVMILLVIVTNSCTSPFHASFRTTHPLRVTTY